MEKIFRKDVNYENIKSYKKPRIHPPVNTILEKPQNRSGWE